MSSVAFGHSLPAADRWRLVELEGWRRGEGLPCRKPPCRERGSEGGLPACSASGKVPVRAPDSTTCAGTRAVYRWRTSEASPGGSLTAVHLGNQH